MVPGTKRYLSRPLAATGSVASKSNLETYRMKTMIIMCDPVAVITGFVTGFCTEGKPTPCI